ALRPGVLVDAAHQGRLAGGAAEGKRAGVGGSGGPDVRPHREGLLSRGLRAGAIRDREPAERRDGASGAEAQSQALTARRRDYGGRRVPPAPLPPPAAAPAPN